MYATKMLQSFKGLRVHCIKGAHTHKERCTNIALCVHVFTFRVDNMTSFPSRRSQCHLSVDCLFHASSDQQSAPQRKARPWIFSHVSVCVSGHVLTLASEEIFMNLCVFSVNGWVEIFSRAILMKACTATLWC